MEENKMKVNAQKIDEIATNIARKYSRNTTISYEDMYQDLWVKALEIDTDNIGILITSLKNYAIDHKTGEKNGKTVQIDQMFGDVDWLKFAYYSDAYIGNVKGLHRTQLMLHLFSYKNHTFAHGKGITNKTTGEQVANKPEKAVELLNELYNFHIDEKTLQNYHNLQ